MKSIVKFIRRIRMYIEARKLKDKDITIIANNCIGSFIYQDMGLKYNSPTVALLFYAPDYILFLKNMDHYLSQEIRFITESKYCGKTNYPLGMLDDIEIHFVHYKNNAHARNKWHERVQRINKSKLFIIGAEVENCTPQIVEEFDRLPYKNKMFFTYNKYPHLKSVIYMRNQLPDYLRWRDWNEYINLVKWFNEEGDYII